MKNKTLFTLALFSLHCIFSPKDKHFNDHEETNRKEELEEIEKSLEVIRGKDEANQKEITREMQQSQKKAEEITQVINRQRNKNK